MKKLLVLAASLLAASPLFAADLPAGYGTKDHPPKCALPNGLTSTLMIGLKRAPAGTVLCFKCFPTYMGVKADGYCGLCAEGQGVLSSGACGACPAGQVPIDNVCKNKPAAPAPKAEPAKTPPPPAGAGAGSSGAYSPWGKNLSDCLSKCGVSGGLTGCNSGCQSHYNGFHF